MKGGVVVGSVAWVGLNVWRLYVWNQYLRRRLFDVTCSSGRAGWV